MNTHLTDEQRLAYLEGEASAETTNHVKTCAECRTQIESWRWSMNRLENLGWPAPVTRRPAIAMPMLRWGVAAGIVLCVGFGLGRLTGPSAAKIQAAVKAEVTRDLETRLAAVRKYNPEKTDLTPILSALSELRDQQAANYVSLRKDLETLASTADARIQLTTRRLAELDATRLQFSRDPIQ